MSRKSLSPIIRLMDRGDSQQEALCATGSVDLALRQAPAARELAMSTTLETAVADYLRSGNPARGTRAEYQTTLRKWKEWGGGVQIETLGRKELREFLDWVYQHAVAEHGTNPGRTANKAREHLRAVLAWAWDQEVIQTPPRFPKPRQQRDVAGRHYLTKAEINALYFATQWAATGGQRLFFSSTTVSILEPSGSPRRSTSRSSGGMSPGIASRRTAKRRNNRHGDGCIIGV